MNEAKKIVFLLAVLAGLALPVTAQKSGDDKKPPPKDKPPVVVVPPKSDRDRPKEERRDNPKKPD